MTIIIYLLVGSVKSSTEFNSGDAGARVDVDYDEDGITGEGRLNWTVKNTTDPLFVTNIPSGKIFHVKTFSKQLMHLFICIAFHCNRTMGEVIRRRVINKTNLE